MSRNSRRVYLTFASANQQLAELVADMFAQSGFRVRLCTATVANDNRPQHEQIVEVIKSCDLFVILLTAQSRDSDMIVFEYGVARAFSKRIIAMFDGVSREEIPEYLFDAQICGISHAPSFIAGLNEDTAVASR